jgi:hypothetical protein
MIIASLRPRMGVFKLIICCMAILLLCPLHAVAGSGVDWHLRSPMAFFGVAFGHDMFVATGENGTILTSSDGKTWSSVESGTKQSLQAVTYGNNIFIGRR